MPKQQRTATGETLSEHVRSLISEAVVSAALDGTNPAKVEKWLHEKLRPYLIKSAR